MTVEELIAELQDLPPRMVVEVKVEAFGTHFCLGVECAREADKRIDPVCHPQAIIETSY